MVSANDDPDLSRNLGVFTVFTVATGTMIGAGIFVLPGPAAAGAGPAAALSFLLAGSIAMIATMCSVELATAMPRAGGSYHFASRSMGPLIGTIVGLGAWISLIFKGSFALVGLGWYITYFSPFPILAVAAIGGLILIVLNWVGARETGRLQNLVVLGLVAILAVFAGSGIFAIEQATLEPFVPEGIEGVVMTTGLVFISYLGIVKATAVAGEAKDPGRTLPRALLSSVVFVTFLYVLVMLIITGVMPIPDIEASTTPVADAGSIFLGTFGGAMVALAGIFATVSTANAAILSSSRFPFAMARDGLLSPTFKHISPRFGTPGPSIWFTGLVMVGLALLLDVEQLAKLGGTFGILVFALLNVIVVLLRASRPEWYDPEYRVPLSPVLPLIGAAAAVLLIPFMGLLSQLTAIGFILIGIGWYAIQTRTGEPVHPDHDIRDQLKRVEYRQAIEEKEERLPGDTATGAHILVEIEAEQPNQELLEILASFAHHLDAILDVMVITEVPSQIPIGEYDHDVDREWLTTLEERLEEKECSVSFDHILARDRTDALLNKINGDTELLVVEWHDPIRKYHLRESHVDEILRTKVPVNLAVFKHRDPNQLQDLVVATTAEPYNRAEVELADAIANWTSAALTLVKVIPEDASQEVETTAEEYLNRLTDLVESPAQTELLYRDDVETALIERGNDADLLLLGAPGYTDRLHDFFGQTTDIVAAETESSVLVAKDADTQMSWYRRLWQRFSRKRQ